MIMILKICGRGRPPGQQQSNDRKHTCYQPNKDISSSGGEKKPVQKRHL